MFDEKIDCLYPSWVIQRYSLSHKCTKKVKIRLGFESYEKFMSQIKKKLILTKLFARLIWEFVTSTILMFNCSKKCNRFDIIIYMQSSTDLIIIL